MRDQLFIRIHNDETSFSWGIVSSDSPGAFEERGELLLHDLELLGEKPIEQMEVIVLVPTWSVLHQQVQLPTKQAKQMLQALPFALEENLIESVESQHFAMGSTDVASGTNVLVVSQEKMQAWRAALTAANVQADILTPVAFALPAFDDAWTLLVEDDELQIRDGAERVFSCPESLLDDIIAIEAADSDEAEHLALRVYQEGQSGFGQELASTVATQYFPIDDSFLWLARNFQSSQAINLLQQEYAVKRSFGEGFSQWRLAAACFAFFVLSFGLYKGSEWFTLNQKVSAQQTYMEELFTTALPGETMSRDPQGQLQAALDRISQGSGNGGFFQLLSAYSTESASQVNLQTTNVTYQSANNELVVDLIVKDLNTINQLKNRLGSRGFEVRDGTSTRDGDSFSSNIVIRSL